MSWDTSTDLHELTSAMSRGSVNKLILRDAKIVQGPGTPPPITSRGRSTTRRDLNSKSDGGNSGNDTCPLAGVSNLEPMTIPSQATTASRHDPASHVLRLNELCISPPLDHILRGAQHASETFAILSALFSIPPVVDHSSLKRLAIPGIEPESFPELLQLLQQKGIARGVQSLVLSDKLILTSTAGNPRIPDLQCLSNLQHLHLGVYLTHEQTNHTVLGSSPPSEKSYTLLWLIHFLSTLPPTLRFLVLKLGISTNVMTSQEPEWRFLADTLRSLGSKPCMRVDVHVNVDMDPDRDRSVRGFGMGNIERGRGRGRARSRMGFGSGIVGSSTGADMEALKKWFEALFGGSHLGGVTIQY